jgi:hypothetical protein
VRHGGPAPALQGQAGLGTIPTIDIPDARGFRGNFWGLAVV